MTARETKLEADRENALGWFRASERGRIALLSEVARLREALELAQNLVPPAFISAREHIAAVLYRPPTYERNEAEMSTHNASAVQVKNTGITCDEESLSEASTVKAETNSGQTTAPIETIAGPHSGPIRQDEVRMVHDAAWNAALEEAVRHIATLPVWCTCDDGGQGGCVHDAAVEHVVAAIRALGAKP